MTTTKGSVEYGVLHLHTPLLLIIGHSACGAIKAALGDYSAEPDDIKHELDTIHITKGDEWMKAVITNVNNQVATALKKFAHQVEDGHLAVMGAVYDFRDDLKHGKGKLTMVNLNGETDTTKIKQSPLLQGIEEMTWGHKRLDARPLRGIRAQLVARMERSGIRGAETGGHPSVPIYLRHSPLI